MSFVYLITDSNCVKLYRFEDPLRGIRTLPNFEEILAGKVEVTSTSTFSVDLENHTVLVNEGGKCCDIGGVLTYWVMQ